MKEGSLAPNFPLNRRLKTLVALKNTGFVDWLGALGFFGDPVFGKKQQKGALKKHWFRRGDRPKCIKKSEKTGPKIEA